MIAAVGAASLAINSLNDLLSPELPGPRLILLPALGHAPAHPVARVGRRRLRRCPPREHTHASRHRRSLVSLVSRDGSRVLRRSRDRADRERKFYCREG